MSDKSPYKEGGKLFESAATVTFTCQDGYSFDGTLLESGIPGSSNKTQIEMKCSTLLSDQFEPPIIPKQCAPISCGRPPARPNANWFLSSENKDYNAGEKVDYACEPGLGIRGADGAIVGTSYPLECTSTGWEVDNPHVNMCIKISCPTDPVVAHGMTVGPYKEVMNVGDEVKFECSYGYAPVGGVDALSCTNSGNFEPENYGKDLCQPVQCPLLPDTILGAARPLNVTRMKFGDDPVLFNCNPAWGAPPVKVTCLQDKSYQIDGVQCKEPSCGVLARGINNAVAPRMLVAPIGSSGEATCLNGFVAYDQSVQFKVVCAPGGFWTPEDTKYRDGCPESANSADPVLLR